MGIFYLLPFIVLLLGFLFWMKSTKINFWEWLGSFMATLLVVGVIHAVYYNYKGYDFEYINSYVTSTQYIPKWKSNEQYVTCSKCGKSTCCTTHHYVETHNEKWKIYTNINKDYVVSKEKYNEISEQFGNEVIKKRGNRPSYRSGDKNDYWVNNTKNAIVPITDTHNWTNKIKMSKNNYNYIDLPDTIKIPNYPEHTSIFRSNKLVLDANKHFDILALDKVNAVLGALKKVNLIIVGLNNEDAMMGDYIESKWYGGKKNDIVIVYNNTDNMVNWVKVFGWTDSELLKLKIESILLNRKTEELNDLLYNIHTIIVNEYTLKDFNNFNYLNMDVSTVAYVIGILIILIIIAFYYYIMYNNDINE